VDRDEAQALAYALEGGALGVREAQAWADGEIRQALEPTSEILAISTERDLPQIVSLLHIIGAGANPQNVGARVYAHLLKGLGAGTISPERAAEVVLRLTRESAAPCRDAESESWFFDDAFYLAGRIYGNRAEVVATLESHLRKYAV